MNYQIIATDLDGTLLNSQMELSQENKAAIEKMAEMGVYFVPSTGRSLSEISREVKELDAARYFITSNGGAVFDRVGGECIIQRGITGEAKAFLLAQLRKYQSTFTIHYNGVSYVDADRMDKDYYRSYRMNELFIRHVYDKDTPIGDFDAFCDKMDAVESCCCFFRTEEDLAACREILRTTGWFSVTASMPYNLEINAIAAGKGTALLALAERLGVDPAKTIGVGDSTNDADNLQKAGLGLAVRNAHPALLRVADKVICTNDEHAMEYILNHIIQ